MSTGKLGAFLGSDSQGVSRIPGFASWVGAPVQVGRSYLASANWTDLEGPNWVLNPWTEWANAESGRIFALNVPMLSPNEPNTCGSDATIAQRLQNGADGDYSHHFQTLAERLIARGGGSTTLVLGWEMTGFDFCHRATPNPTAWTAYWREIVDTMRAVSGASFTFCFAPNRGPDSIDWQTIWPGDEYVDEFGLSAYDQPQGSTVQSQRTEPNGLDDAAAWASARGLQLSFPEWGLFRNGDRASYIDMMHDFMATHPVRWHSITDYNPHGVYLYEGNPQSSARYQELFSATTGTGPTMNINDIPRTGLVWPFGNVPVQYVDGWDEWRDGGSRLHRATDIYQEDGGSGAPVYAAEGGVVDSWMPGVSHQEIGGGGYQVRIDTHDGELRWVYAHLGNTNQGPSSAYAVSPGDTVVAGQLIGWLGTSGNTASGPHVHMEMRDLAGIVNDPDAPSQSSLGFQDGPRFNPYPTLQSIETQALPVDLDVPSGWDASYQAPDRAVLVWDQVDSPQGIEVERNGTIVREVHPGGDGTTFEGLSTGDHVFRIRAFADVATDPDGDFNADGVELVAFEPTPGSGSVTVEWTIRTNRPVSFDQMVVACRGPAGANLDFGHGSREVDGQSTFDASRSLSGGLYTAWIAYNLGSGWVDLNDPVQFEIESTNGGGNGGGDPSVGYPPQSESWNLEFVDTFDAPLDNDVWHHGSWSQGDQFGNRGQNNQLEGYTQGQRWTEDSMLVIESRQQPVTINGYTYSWRSGLATTRNSFTFRTGYYVEARIRTDGRRGFWPAFWTWQRDGCGTVSEIDIWEHWSGWGHDRYLATTHVNWASGGSRTVWYADYGTAATEWNVYGAWIEQNLTRWYFNGQQVHSVTGTPPCELNLICQQQVPSDDPPQNYGSTAPSYVYFDWVRGWRRTS